MAWNCVTFHVFAVYLLLALLSIVSSVISGPSEVNKKFDFEVSLPSVALDDSQDLLLGARNKKFFQPFKINMPYFKELANSRRPAFLPTYHSVYGSKPVQYVAEMKRSPSQSEQHHKIQTRALEDIKNCYFSPVQCYLLERRRRRSVSADHAGFQH